MVHGDGGVSEDQQNQDADDCSDSDQQAYGAIHKPEYSSEKQDCDGCPYWRYPVLVKSDENDGGNRGRHYGFYPPPVSRLSCTHDLRRLLFFPSPLFGNDRVRLNSASKVKTASKAAPNQVSGAAFSVVLLRH